ncbi:hypothetical protein [Cytobacillus purgationiresistens]|uniref:Yip1 domain-containing protein n=1 Tax=Cytobacillus purgationiresistens TaxID=863449 RepID=A0ABU0AD88_9BACI|nr:hypothetical protein [Cytobacillus purgationiresistens]MDQ0269219.1 hypothetical protein [Cytobacillus purgationiresistens]
MGYRVPLFRGLREPYIISHQLRKEESFVGLWKRILLLVAVSMAIMGFSVYFGIGSEIVSKSLTDLARSDYEAYKTLFGAGQIVWGLIWALLVIFIPSLFFWTLIDVEYRKLLSVQLFVTIIFLIEKVVNIPFSIFLGVGTESNIFSLGIIVQSLTSIELIIHFFANITLFQIWAVIIQYIYFRRLSEKSPRFLLFTLIGFYLFVAMVSSLLSYIKFENII